MAFLKLVRNIIQKEENNFLKLSYSEKVISLFWGLSVLLIAQVALIKHSLGMFLVGMAVVIYY